VTAVFLAKQDREVFKLQHVRVRHAPADLLYQLRLRNQAWESVITKEISAAEKVLIIKVKDSPVQSNREEPEKAEEVSVEKGGTITACLLVFGLQEVSKAESFQEIFGLAKKDSAIRERDTQEILRVEDR
jgi:hypothetical protein